MCFDALRFILSFSDLITPKKNYKAEKHRRAFRWAMGSNAHRNSLYLFCSGGWNQYEVISDFGKQREREKLTAP